MRNKIWFLNFVRLVIEIFIGMEAVSGIESILIGFRPKSAEGWKRPIRNRSAHPTVHPTQIDEYSSTELTDRTIDGQSNSIRWLRAGMAAKKKSRDHRPMAEN